MRAATCMAHALGILSLEDQISILNVLDRYGPIPSVSGISAEALNARLVKDKKTIQAKIHFVLPIKIGEVVVKSDVPPDFPLRAIERALADCQ